MKCWLPSIKGVGENREYLKKQPGTQILPVVFLYAKLKFSLSVWSGVSGDKNIEICKNK